MFDTNDVYNDAVRGSSFDFDESNRSKGALMGSKIVSLLLLGSIAYVGFNFYTKNSVNFLDEALVVNNKLIVEKELVVKNELVAEIQTKSELLVNVKPDNSEEDYLTALRAIETELTESRESITLDTSEQMSLSSAMGDIMNDTVLASNTDYTKELRKEIGAEVDDVADTHAVIVKKAASAPVIVQKADSRSVIVKKGDTLQGISNKFYGDAMNYKRIIASNDSLNTNDTIYVGQTILLPY